MMGTSGIQCDVHSTVRITFHALHDFTFQGYQFNTKKMRYTLKQREKFEESYSYICFKFAYVRGRDFNDISNIGWLTDFSDI